MQKPTIEQVKQAKEILKANGYILNLYHRDDIQDIAEDRGYTLAETEVDEIIKRLEEMDLSLNWESIEFMVEEFVYERGG